MSPDQSYHGRLISTELAVLVNIDGSHSRSSDLRRLSVRRCRTVHDVDVPLQSDTKGLVQVVYEILEVLSRRSAEHRGSRQDHHIDC